MEENCKLTRCRSFSPSLAPNQTHGSPDRPQVNCSRLAFVQNCPNQKYFFRKAKCSWTKSTTYKRPKHINMLQNYYKKILAKNFRISHRTHSLAFVSLPHKSNSSRGPIDQNTNACIFFNWRIHNHNHLCFTSRIWWTREPIFYAHHQARGEEVLPGNLL